MEPELQQLVILISIEIPQELKRAMITIFEPKRNVPKKLLAVAAVAVHIIAAVEVAIHIVVAEVVSRKIYKMD